MRLATLLIAVVLAAPLSAQIAPSDWPAYGRDALGSRFSPLNQITGNNVGTLVEAWTYRTGEMGAAGSRTIKLEATPLVVEGVMYFSTPLGRAIALDAATGRELWSFDGKASRTDGWGDFANRGVSTWVDSRAATDAPCRRTIFVPIIDGRIVSLDARTGTPCRAFGEGGTVALRRGLQNAPAYKEEYELTSPPAVIRDLIVTGSAIADNYRTSAASGEVRAYDARTGALRWAWDPVPRDSTDPAWRTWIGAIAHSTGGANAWSIIAADSARDLVFVPTTSASPDYYGGERVGDNRYANSIVALRASTGQVVWHFQTVHHDLWDYDNAAPPALVTITHNGRRVDVVLQATKSGQLFVLDRDTGLPVFPVEERAVPPSSIYGERASPTQPFNTVLPALGPQRFTMDSLFALTPAMREACEAIITPLRNEGPFTPPSLEGTLAWPSNIGGAHWGGVAFDPQSQYVVIPVNRIAARVQLIRLDQLDTAEARTNSSRLGDQYTRMHGTPYVMRRNMVNTNRGIPCTPPPWGALLAIDLKTGRRAWEVPLGDPVSLRPDLSGLLKPEFGTPNLGGPIVTASGIVFIGATFDHALRAFDLSTGKLLWKGTLPGGARATPMTYEAGGRQYVVVAVGGGEDWGDGDYVVAFALPRR